MNQAEVSRLVSALRVNLGPRPRKIKHIMGYRGGLENLRETVTGLIVNERLEMSENRGVLTRQYTERLISDAIFFGDTHKRTMEVAAWWLDSDRSAIHKLFKVLVPRFKELDKSLAYTKLFFPPKNILTNYENMKFIGSKRKVLVELRGNPFPPLEYPNARPNKKLIHNVLLAEAARDIRFVGSEKKP